MAHTILRQQQRALKRCPCVRQSFSRFLEQGPAVSRFATALCQMSGRWLPRYCWRGAERRGVRSNCCLRLPTTAVLLSVSIA